MLSFATVFLASIIGSSLGAAVNNTGLVDTLRDAPTAVDRVNDLPQDSQFVFDFFNPPAGVATGAGGSIILANVASFPAVVGNGVAMAVGILEPCGMNTPHTHPRATEIQYNVNGTIRTGMITENGGRFIMTDLQPGQMTIFPQGSIHFQINEGCEPALFVSGLNSEDPGALQIAQRFFGLPPDIVAATLGDIGVEEVMGLSDLIPDNVALGADECLQRCGITRTSQPTAQQQTRVSGNAFPSGVTASTYATGYQSSATSTASKSGH
ncbi:RmlC-like cupin domain-containing protein [Mycena sanguinolenta]|nr:RmlC-like cupin domain-containing protein [Mycena sanguinolenta]KAJ6469470.1 RmlC-like cupin domain-containing protein [Mycena sanguinolenta]